MLSGDIMADIVTHATFALDVALVLKDESLLNSNRMIYFLGSQGPDVFYFYNLLGFYQNTTYKKFGNYMHNNKASEFLSESVKYLKDNYNDSLYSYLCGFICHHALDRNVHPYVYHVTGTGDIKYRGNHLHLERAIDSWFIINRWNKKRPHRFKIYKEIINFKIDKALYQKFYDTIVKKVYNKENGGKVFINSISNFRRYIRLIYDRYGLKKKIARTIDRCFNKKGKIVLEKVFYYQNFDKNIDYFNFKHKKWSHPVIKNKISEASFIDLYNNALNQAVREINQVNLFLEGKLSEADLRLVIKDLSYATGLLCSENNEMKYFNVIF